MGRMTPPGAEGSGTSTAPRRAGHGRRYARLALDSAEQMEATTRSYSPGLKGVLAGETALAMIDGEAGRIQYRGYPIGELVERGTYAQVAELLWTGDWRTDAPPSCAPPPAQVVEGLPRPPSSTGAMDALRTAISPWGA